MRKDFIDNESTLIDVNTLRLFESVPGKNLLILNNPPHFTIAGVSNDYLKLIQKSREELVGQGIFESFPSNRNNPDDQGEFNLRTSFQEVIEQNKRSSIITYRYDVLNSEDEYEERHWKIFNTPIPDLNGELKYIIHNVEEITYEVKWKQQESYIKEVQIRNSLFMEAPVAIQILRGPELIIEFANELTLELWGKKSDVIGKPLPLILPELIPQGLIDLIQNVYTTGIPYEAYEVGVYIHKNGKREELFFNFTYQPFYESGKSRPDGVLIFASEVTEKVAAKEELRQRQKENQELVSIVEASHEFVGMSLPNGEITYLNQAALKMLGWTDCKGRLIKECIYRDDYEKSEKLVPLLLENKAFSQEIRFVNENTGEPFWMRWNGFTVNDPVSGEVVGLATVSPNIHELKQTEQSLRESELRFRKLADESPIFVFITKADEHASIIYWNKTWLDYTGQTMEEALGRAWNGIIHPDDIPTVFEHYIPAFNRQKEYLIPAIRVKKADGTYRWHSFKGNPRYTDGVFNGYVGVGFDIHDQKLYENVIKQSEIELKNMVAERTEALQSQKLLLDNILANSSNGISVTEMVRNENGNVIDATTILANDSAIKLTGLPREFYLSKTAKEIDPGILESPYGILCLKTLNDGEPGIIQYFLEHTRKWLELTISKMDDDHLIHIFTDVTPIKESQLQLERTVEELRKSNQNLEEFAYAASHDLKEPIRKIHFFSDRIKTTLGDRMTDEEKRSFERMELASLRMNSLIDDLLTYSKISIRPATFEPVDLNQLVDQVLSDLDLEIDQRSASIRIDKLCTIQGHHRQLQQAFQNLLANALKYGRSGVKIEIHIRYKQTQGKDIGLSLSSIQNENLYHVIEIVDNGIGFEPEDAERIFNVFTRLHGNTEYKGTGVGLSIVRKVIENHNGFITAHGEPGKGSIFSVYFPAKNL
jgi:PAS domain S-box-containing protein